MQPPAKQGAGKNRIPDTDADPDPTVQNLAGVWSSCVLLARTCAVHAWCTLLPMTACMRNDARCAGVVALLTAGGGPRLLALVSDGLVCCAWVLVTGCV
jgi:hypothetical protein